MDFTFTEEQETIAKVARQLFEHRATPDRLTDLEAGAVRYDASLWRQLVLTKESHDDSEIPHEYPGLA